MGQRRSGEIDANVLDAVSVTLVAFPSKDGDPLTVHYVLHFADGQTLDITVSGRMVSLLGGCAAG
jgi:hypothetical protein